MLDFVEFQERKILNELAVQIKWKPLIKKLKPYSKDYMHKMDIESRLSAVKRFIVTYDKKGITSQIKKDMSSFGIEDDQRATDLIKAVRNYQDTGFI